MVLKANKKTKAAESSLKKLTGDLKTMQKEMSATGTTEKFRTSCDSVGLQLYLNLAIHTYTYSEAPITESPLITNFGATESFK